MELLFIACPIDLAKRAAKDGFAPGDPVSVTCPLGPTVKGNRQLVVDAHACEEHPLVNAPLSTRIPPSALLNAKPYRPPRKVIAAGGVVMRGNRILLIKRRGVWDLPKGKRDRGESIEACALREVREELGIEDLTLGEPLGVTQHGYREASAYRVKTTYWFRMTTSAATFVPQADEQITRVRWVAYPKAVERVGFDTLRELLERHRGLLTGVGP